MGYNRDFLMEVRDNLPAIPPLPQAVVSNLRKLNINRIPTTIRGSRGGKHHQHAIPVITSYAIKPAFTTGCNANNLISVTTLNVQSECLPIEVITTNRGINRYPKPINNIVLEKEPTPRINNIIGKAKINTTNLKSIQTSFSESSTSSKNLTTAIINARSIKNKSTSIKEYVIDNNIDITAITETWLGADGRDGIVEVAITPPGYSLCHVPRSQGTGGGVALLFKTSLNVSQTQCKSYHSFEVIELKLSFANCLTMLLSVIYRPPPSKKNGFTNKQFLDEFSNFIDDRILLPDKLVICGDFNFHVDNQSCKDSTSFMSLLKSYGLAQLVAKPTHTKGHTLDLLITRSTETFISNIEVKDMCLSDHFWVHFSSNFTKPGITKKHVKYRNISKICRDSFINDICNSALSTPENVHNISDLVKIYNTVLSELLDKHAPLKERVFTLHNNAPWYTSEISNTKRECRKAERRFRRTGLTIHKQIFSELQIHMHSLIDTAKTDFYKNKVKEANQKDLFKIVNELIKPNDPKPLPTHDSPKELADRFCEFFSSKIAKIRHELVELQSSRMNNEATNSKTLPGFSEFLPASQDEVKKLILSTKSKSCSMDPIPTSLLKECLSSLLPVITTIVNLSMSQGIVSADLKKALIAPLLKKNGLDIEILKHFRPVSNLTYISKIIERLVACRFLHYIYKNNLQEVLQSSYTKFHSTETALIKVQNDFLEAIDGKKCILLVLLDLSAAFDTIDHQILLSRLSERFGVKDTALKWFASYLSERYQSVVINGVESDIQELQFGVPQGSVLGPILFILYTSPLGELLQSCGVSYHFYADDTQLYLSFNHSESQDAIVKMEKCISQVSSWMSENFLKLNEDKTEVMFLGSPNFLSKFKNTAISVGMEHIQPSDVVRNIGAYIDKHLNMDKHVNNICKGAWMHLRNIGKLRPFLDNSSCEKLVHAFVSSKIDSNNGLLYGITKDKIHKIQRVQNAAARIVSRTPKYDHITPILKSLHWLPVSQRIDYKILLLAFKCLNNIAPIYLQELLEISCKPRALRSNSNNVLLCPRTKSVKYGNRTFTYSASTLWNSLPLPIRQCKTVSDFKCKVKTHLFKIAYD